MDKPFDDGLVGSHRIFFEWVLWQSIQILAALESFMATLLGLKGSPTFDEGRCHGRVTIAKAFTDGDQKDQCLKPKSTKKTRSR
jgi:hypothetical protein